VGAANALLANASVSAATTATNTRRRGTERLPIMADSFFVYADLPRPHAFVAVYATYAEEYQTFVEIG
jgi:hypothetical protein